MGRRRAVPLRGQVLERRPARGDVRRAPPAHQAAAAAAPADRRRRPVEDLGHAQAGRRARLPAAVAEPQPGVRRVPLGQRRGRRTGERPHAVARRLAARARGVRRRDRRGGLAPVGRLDDGPDDGRVLPAAARQLRLPRLPQARSRRARQRRDAGVLRRAQLDHRLARHGGREAGEGVRRLRRLRPDPRVRLRLLRRPRRRGCSRSPRCRRTCCRVSPTSCRPSRRPRSPAPADGGSGVGCDRARPHPTGRRITRLARDLRRSHRNWTPDRAPRSAAYDRRVGDVEWPQLRSGDRCALGRRGGEPGGDGRGGR